VPGGIGVFETILLVLLPDRIPQAELLGALVAYRAIYNLLPLVVAALALGAHEALRRREGLARAADAFGRWTSVLTPSVFAVTTFAGGVLLLISGATPARAGRLRWASALLPLPVVEASHLLASVAGLGLVLLAAGLRRRLDAAYHLTLALLGAGALLSLAKGLDYEEAAVLLVMLAALLPARRHFYRRASLWAEPFAPAWTTAVLLVLIGTAWLGRFAFQHVDYGHELWWRFTVSADAPRSLRAAVAVAVLALVVAVTHRLRVARPAPVAPTAEALARALRIAARSPDAAAKLVLLGDKSLLFSDDGGAFLMFGAEGRSLVALGDAVGPPAACVELTWQFRELADRRGAWPVFHLVGPQHVARYVDLGLTLLPIGEAAEVALADFAIDGPRRTVLARAVRAARAAGAVFELVPRDGVPALLPELRTLRDASASAHESGFALGAARDHYLRRFPAAVVRRRGRVVAFASVLEGAAGAGLTADVLRAAPDAPAGSVALLLAELMLWGRGAGYATFDLGTVPQLGPDLRDEEPLWRRVAALPVRLALPDADAHALRRFKASFDPSWTPRWVASPGGMALPRIMADVGALIARGPAPPAGCDP